MLTMSPESVTFPDGSGSVGQAIAGTLFCTTTGGRVTQDVKATVKVTARIAGIHLRFVCGLLMLDDLRFLCELCAELLAFLVGGEKAVCGYAALALGESVLDGEKGYQYCDRWHADGKDKRGHLSGPHTMWAIMGACC